MAGPQTIVHMLRSWAEKRPDAPALYRRGPSGWTAQTWRDYERTVRSVGKALIALGHRPGEPVALIGRNRPEWLGSQFGIMAAAGVPAPIYTTNTAEQVAYVVRHSGARFVIAENKDQHEKLVAERTSLGPVEKVVLMDDVAGRDPKWTMLWTDLIALGEKGDDAALEARLRAAKPDDLAFLPYTSGTTGNPKGVMLSHANLLFMTKVGGERYGIGPERVLSYLPLCHVAEQIITNFVQIYGGGEVFLCEDLLKLRDYLPEVRPTIFLGVPRVWEKFQAALKARLAEAKGLKKKIAGWALRTELRAFQREVETGRPVAGARRRLARKLAVDKVRAALGLDRVRLCFTGAAPIHPDTQDFFASLGLPLYEGYGMTETSGLLTTTLPGKPRFGTVGRPFEGVQVKIAEDGEILAQGPNLCAGYFKEEEQTKALWEGGWLHTGDVGMFDAEGNLKITDRKKELFKTSGGKYVAPQPIEMRLKTIRGVSQAAAVGDSRKYIAALVTLDAENAPKVALELGLTPGAGGVADLARDPLFRAHLEKRVEEDVNGKLARYEQVKRFAVLPADFTIAGGELTATMKLRRKVIAQKYAKEIESLFADEDAVAAATGGGRPVATAAAAASS